MPLLRSAPRRRSETCLAQNRVLLSNPDRLPPLSVMNLKSSEGSVVKKGSPDSFLDVNNLRALLKVIELYSESVRLEAVGDLLLVEVLV